MIFLGPFTWITVSTISQSPLSRRIRAVIRRARAKLSLPKDLDLRLLLVVVLYLLLFEGVLTTFPTHVLDTVISSTSLVFITVEGFMLALSAQIKHDRLRKSAVTTAIVAVLTATITIAVANLQALQFKILSTDVVTILFQVDGGLFAIVVFSFAEGVLLSDRSIERERQLVISEEP